MKQSCRNARPLRAVIALVLAASAAAAAAEDLTQLDLDTLMNMNVTLVTAQKRTENVNEVPISMVVLTADDLRRHTLGSTAELQSVAPGLTTSTKLDLMVPYIRGVGTDNVVSIEPSVSLYVDGIYRTDRTETSMDLFDADQIEILRGPQGALYGHNSLGGAIKVTTRGPTAKPEATVQLTGGNYGLRDGSLFVGGPLAERVRASFSAHARQKDAYYTNIIGLDEPRAEDFFSLHGRMQVDVADNFSAEVLLKYFERDDGMLQATEISNLSTPAVLGDTVATEQLTSAAEAPPGSSRSTVRNAALKLDWIGARTRVQSISSYDAVTYDTLYDLDVGAAPLASSESSAPRHTLTQELHFTPGTQSGRLDWLAGLFYMQSTASLDPARFVTFTEQGSVSRTIRSETQVRAIAGFGETTLALTDALSLITGVRYSTEKKSLVDHEQELQLGSIALDNRSSEWDKISYRAVVKYSTARTLFYAKTETAFKTGAYNMLAVVDTEPTKPENITAYEIGVKHGFAHVPVRVAAAAFHNDYRDQQLQLVDETTNGALFAVAPKSRTRGVDLSIDAKLGKRLSVSGGLEWLDATYRQFVTDGVLVPNPLGGNLLAQDMDLAGKRLPRSPKLTANLGLAYEHPTPNGAWFGDANYYHSSRVYFDAANNYSQGAFATLSARAGYRSASGWHVAAWAKNLTDERYLSGTLLSLTGTSGWYEPRTYGITIGYSFGD